MKKTYSHCEELPALKGCFAEAATKAGAPAPALNRNPFTVPSKDGTKQSPNERLLRPPLLRWRARND